MIISSKWPYLQNIVLNNSLWGEHSKFSEDMYSFLVLACYPFAVQNVSGPFKVCNSEGFNIFTVCNHHH